MAQHVHLFYNPCSRHPSCIIGETRLLIADAVQRDGIGRHCWKCAPSGLWAGAVGRGAEHTARAAMGTRGAAAAWGPVFYTCSRQRQQSGSGTYK